MRALVPVRSARASAAPVLLGVSRLKAAALEELPPIAGPPSAVRFAERIVQTRPGLTALAGRNPPGGVRRANTLVMPCRLFPRCSAGS